MEYWWTTFSVFCLPHIRAFHNQSFTNYGFVTEENRLLMSLSQIQKLGWKCNSAVTCYPNPNLYLLIRMCYFIYDTRDVKIVLPWVLLRIRRSQLCRCRLGPSSGIRPGPPRVRHPVRSLVDLSWILWNPGTGYRHHRWFEMSCKQDSCNRCILSRVWVRVIYWKRFGFSSLKVRNKFVYLLTYLSRCILSRVLDGTSVR